MLSIIALLLGAVSPSDARPAAPAAPVKVVTSLTTYAAIAREIVGHGHRAETLKRARKVGFADSLTDSAAAAVDEARARHGGVRILVNCAGIGPPKRIVGRDGPMPLADFDRVIRVNLIGTFNLMRLAAADMAKLEPLADNERGVIVSTASVAAYEGQIGQAAYAASKGGVVGLTLPAARELAQFGIRVLTIAPGLFLTPLLRSLPEDVQASLAAAVPYPRRLGDPNEFADLVLHMARSNYLNGEVIRLDGALRMAPR